MDGEEKNQNNTEGLPYILEHVTGRPYENRTPKMVQQEFLNNCGGLVANTQENRKSFVKNNPKIRYLVVGMGLMASGKTTGFKEARNYCRLINASAYNKPWESIDSGALSIDELVTNNENYKTDVAKIFTQEEFEEFPDDRKPWTQYGWNQWRKPQKKRQFLTQMVNAYNTARQGREEWYHYEDLKKISLKNLSTAILEGKNIEYETTGARFDTLKTILQMIVETTFNCKNKYVYIVLGVLNLCSIQESYDQQLCRFFAKSKPFYQAILDGEELPSAPRIGISVTTQVQNELIYNNMLALIKACNKQITTDHAIFYKGVCLGFGIDILLVSYNPPRIERTQQNEFNKLIATLPLSVRSRQLIKSTKSNKSILNNRFYHNMVIYILEQLTSKSRFGKNPVDFDAIKCGSSSSFQDVNIIIEEFFQNSSEKQTAIFKKVRSNIQQATPSWTRSLKQGGKRRRRKKTKRRRKRKGKKRKTRRRRKRR